MDASSLSDLTVRDIATTFTASHFEVRGSEQLGAANKGTRPRHPYADVVLSFVLHQVLKALALDLDSGQNTICFKKHIRFKIDSRPSHYTICLQWL